MSNYVLLYNNGGHELLKRVSIKKAMQMLWRGVARVMEVEEGSYYGPFERPRAIELARYIYAKWKYDRTGEVIVSRRGILRRDGFTCAYCGKEASTIDHVQPKSRGGEDSWLNLVAACLKCNNRKADRTPKEAGMRLLFEPRTPHFSEVYMWTKK